MQKKTVQNKEKGQYYKATNRELIRKKGRMIGIIKMMTKMI